MMPSFLALNRLRVIRSGKSVYDEKFHLGVNIIRGVNGSGKSTIADFIFYALGGEINKWKKAASSCNEVQAEIRTKEAIITIRREISDKPAKPLVFFGRMEEAAQYALDKWMSYPLQRYGTQESFSQIMFKSIGMPEAQSQESSNITMHQIMRLLYSDQRTPAPRLFRFESFDTPDIREAVGDLACGISAYEAYETQLKLRDAVKIFKEKAQELEALITNLPNEAALTNIDTLHKSIKNLELERQRAISEIEAVDSLMNNSEATSFLLDRDKAIQEIRKNKNSIQQNEKDAEILSFELAELDKFNNYLKNLSESLRKTEKTAEIIGNIEFAHCPSCLEPLKNNAINQCIVCKEKIDAEKIKSKYLHIRLDIDMQLRESDQLKIEKELLLENIKKEIRSLRHIYEDLNAKLLTQFDLSNSPRESFLARKNQRLGQIEREIEYLHRMKEILEKIQKLSEEKDKLQNTINHLESKKKSLENDAHRRRGKVLSDISNIAIEVLKSDITRQDEFKDPKFVNLLFRDDAIMVDQELNFAESSNVILKNAAVLSLLSAATLDPSFYHPRFLLLDNVEDKGMQIDRSHNFQNLIIRESNKARFDHQIIFTTSMMDPSLEREDLVIGPNYTSEKRTLNLSDE
jgi:DNA repair exonuclease SbcCD ATPase subunit